MLSNGDIRYQSCEICSSLSAQERSYQKFGNEQENNCLPAAANRLQVIHDFRPDSSRKLQLQLCPVCGTYYLYRSDYEYLVNGSEDEEILERLTTEEMIEILRSLETDPSASSSGKH